MSSKSIGIQHIAISLIMVVLLTFFFWQTQTFNLDQHYQIIAHLRYVRKINAITDTDVLKSRFSLNYNYDSLVADISLLQAETYKLRDSFTKINFKVKNDFPTKLVALQSTIKQKEAKIDKFKSQNAILQNSLLYFPTVTQDLINKLNNLEEYYLSAQLNELLQNQLAYNLNLRNNLASIKDTLNELAKIKLLPPELTNQLNNVTAHGETIISLKPLLDELVADIISLSTDEEINNLALSYEQASKQMLMIANYYRLLLYITAIILLTYTASLYRLYQRNKILKIVNEKLANKVNQRTKELENTLEKLQKSQGKLIQAEKMSSLGRLVAGVAHEINNPINFIHGNLTHINNYTQDLLNLNLLYQQEFPQTTEVIEEHIVAIDLEFLGEDLPKVISSIKAGTERVREIVTSLRTFSRLDESEIKSVDLHEGIDSTLMILNSRLQERPSRPCEIKIIKNYGKIPLVKCYASQLNQVFLNIISNAIDALELAFDKNPHCCEPLSDKNGETIPTISISTQLNNSNQVAVSIADNGAGITPEVQQLMFDPFFTTKSVGEGTGLGLSISYQIVTEGHGGELLWDSQPGKGSRFMIVIPVNNLIVRKNLKTTTQKLNNV